MTRLELDRPAIGAHPAPGLYRFPGCQQCQAASFDSPDKELVAYLVRVHRP